MHAERNENENVSADGSQTTSADAAKREQSTIEFPYGDLDDAIEVARAVHEVGGQSCSTDQVAAQLKQSPNGGAFRLRLSYPRVFGLTTNERGVVSLTPLGLKIIDPKQEVSARVEAFLTVPLYRAVYEKYKGYTLPPPAALEREMNKLGVTFKQTDKARQVFERAAKQAGFTWAGADRLVIPALKDKDNLNLTAQPETKPLDQGTPGAVKDPPKYGSGGGEPPDRVEMIRMLLRYLPEHGLDNEKLVRWLKAAEINLRMAYDVPGSIRIEVENAGS